jgi:hypothetical protein
MNYGRLLAYTSVVLCFGACVGYAMVKDWRRSAYYFFAGCITVTVTY